MKFYRAFYLITFTLFSCNNDILTELLDQLDSPSQQPLITIKSTENLRSVYDTNSGDSWIIVSDNKGHVLAYGELDQDSTFTTSNKVEGNINVTLLNVYDDRYEINTYTEVPLNDTWIIPNQVHGPTVNANLEANIKVQNVCMDFQNNSPAFFASNAHGFVGPSFGYSDLRCLETKRPTTVDMIIHIDEQAPKDVLLVANDGILDPTYIWFSEDIFTADHTNIDFTTDLLPMDRVLTYSFNDIKSVYMDIMAYDKENPSYYQDRKGFIHSQFLHNEEEDFYQFKVGYLEGHDSYRSRISIEKTDLRYFYTKFGNPPEVITEDLFDSNFEILNSTLHAFQFSAKGDFDVAQGSWSRREPITRWSIFYPIEKCDNLILLNLPEEIKTRYPNLSLSDLTYDWSSFTDMISNAGYNSFLKYIHKNESGKMATEQYSLFKSAN